MESRGEVRCWYWSCGLTERREKRKQRKQKYVFTAFIPSLFPGFGQERASDRDPRLTIAIPLLQKILRMSPADKPMQQQAISWSRWRCSLTMLEVQCEEAEETGTVLCFDA